MKKLLYSAAALALAFFAGSCQRENLEPVGTGSNTVTYSVQVPGAIATKANPGSVEGVTELVYEVYRLDADDNIVSLAYEDVVTLQGGETKWDLELEFVKDQKFQVLFWAQKPNVGAYNTGDLREVSLNSATLTANVDDYAAFAGYDYVTNCVSHKEGKVTLVRPISQIQVGTDAAGLVLGTEGSNKVNITLSTSSMVVKGLPTTYNVANGEVVEDVQDVEYTVYNVPAGTFTANSKEYTYVAQNYVAFAASLGTTVEVDFTVTTSEGDVEHTVSNVPLKPNYRTNIIGNLITENADYSIDLEADWADDDKSMEVIVDGLVKNINGDYEVTEEKGLAYAINKLFAVGGNFYLTKSLYDLSGFAVTPPTVPAGVTLNIYGETPVVTRSSVIPTVAGVTIIGLDSALIGSIANEANVSISGVNLTDSGSVLVNENLGTLVVSESTASTIVASGNAVDADNVQDINSLNAALATGVKEINITADIEATEVVLVDRSVVINGNDKSFASTATRAFRLTTSDIEVTINNLNIVSNAVRVGTNDVRGVSIDIVNNVSLTLNNCSHAFSDSSANDWAYAVNVTGGDNNEVTVIGGEYEGANVINVRGTSQTVVVKNAILTSTYPASKDYYGACIYVVQNQGSSVYAEGNTFNGNNAMVFNIGEGTALEEKNNVDNTMFYHKGCYYVSSAEKLQTLVNNLTEDATIKFANDLSGKISLTQNAGVDVTILGEGKKFTGGLHIWGNGAADDRSMTLKNISFDGTGLTDDEGCIYTTGAVNGRNSYACNVTIEDCTFTGAGVAAIRQNVAGERDWTIKNCTIAENMHSLLQVSNTNGELVVENCKVYSKNGANLNSTCVATFTGCEFDVRGYAVRVGVNSGGNPDATKLYTFTNCTFESENEDGDAVVIIRKDAQKATLNFVNTELIGDPKISGNTSATKISGIDLPQQNWEIWYTATALVHAHWYKDKFGEGTDLVSNVWDETTGKGVITLSGPVTIVGVNAFYGREHLTSISIPNTVTAIGEYAFDACPNLVSVKFSENLVTIGPGAFGGCESLTDVVIPDSVTTIADAAFQSCESMASVTIPASVTSIGASAFNLSRRDFKVYCKAVVPPSVGYQPFNKWWAEIYVPAASLTAYQDAWGSVVDNIYAE